jgi:hypothetical protein
LPRGLCWKLNVQPSQERPRLLDALLEGVTDQSRRVVQLQLAERVLNVVLGGWSSTTSTRGSMLMRARYGPFRPVPVLYRR